MERSRDRVVPRFLCVRIQEFSKMAPVRKPDATRQRRNKVTTAAQLPTAEEASENTVPKLPPRGKDKDGKTLRWHPMVVRWWASVWRSPMASEYLDADMTGGLYMLAD